MVAMAAQEERPKKARETGAVRGKKNIRRMTSQKIHHKRRNGPDDEHAWLCNKGSPFNLSWFGCAGGGNPAN